jgi:hypothetical protein
MRQESRINMQMSYIVFFFLLIRLLGAAVNIVHDCDEVYNYWEPLHYLVHGSGMQTWEYRCLRNVSIMRCYSLTPAILQGHLVTSVCDTMQQSRLIAPSMLLAFPDLNFQETVEIISCKHCPFTIHHEHKRYHRVLRVCGDHRTCCSLDMD